MKNFYNLKKSLLAATLLASTGIYAQYNDGVLISNEGNFGSPNASISYIEFDSGEIQNNIYQNVNNEPIGDVLQYIGLNENYAYLVVNNSNKVIVANRATMLKVAEITENIDLPRYVSFANDKIYVTCVGTESIEVFSTEDFSHITSIAMGTNADEIEYANDKLFVVDSWFGGSNTISVINPDTDEDVETLTFDFNVKSIDVDDNKLYVINSNEDQSNLTVIDTETLDVITQVESTEITQASRLDVDNGVAYFVANNTEIYAVADGATEMDIEPIVTVTDNSWSTLYGFGVIDGIILSGDASGFVAPSVVTGYNAATGIEIGSVEAGIGTNGFYLNDETLATQEVNYAKSEFSILPNPVDASFVVSEDFEGVLSVYTTSGNIVKRTKYTGEKVNVSFLPAGVYILSLETEEGILTTKMIKK